MMLQYIEHIIVPYIEKVREDVGDNKAALVIMDNFEGQVTDAVTNLLADNNILVTLLPPKQPTSFSRWTSLPTSLLRSTYEGNLRSGIQMM